MKTSNKILLISFSLILLGIVLTTARFGYLAVNDRSSLNVPKYKPVVIKPETSKPQLDSLKRLVEERGGELQFTDIQYNDSGKLVKVAGKVKFPGFEESFQTDSLQHIFIVEGTKKTMVFVNNEKPFMRSAWDLKPLHFD